MYLLVGLGNIGKEYENTRHNFGFMCVDRIISDYNINNHQVKFNADIYNGEIENNKISIYLTTNNSQRFPWVSEWYSRKLIWQGTYNDPEQPTVDYTFTSIGKPVNVIAEDRERVFCFSDGKLSFIREYTYVEEETVPDPDNKVYLTRLDSTLDNSLDIDD